VTELADAALSHAGAGWFVFPVAPRGKTPLTKNGLNDAATDPGLVAAWWAERPNANIGIDCGRSGLLVVDIDSEEAMEVWVDLAAQHGGHAKTLVARTSKGFHFYFAGKGPSSASRLGPKIDTRGAGGYVIAPPSMHGRGHLYRWLDSRLKSAAAPEWMLAALDCGHAELHVGERRELPAGIPYTNYGLAALAAIVDEMATTIEGQRNDTLNRVSYRAGRLCAGGQLGAEVAKRELVAAALQAGLEQEEAETTFASGLGAGLRWPVDVKAAW
jgi:hypothetical protein